MTRWQWGVVIALVLLIVVVFGAVIIIGYNAPNELLQQGSEIKSAYAACQEWTRERLKAPSSAVFPPQSEISAERRNFAWRIRFTVDAQNSFGAFLRSDVYCKVRDRDDSWYLVTLEIE